MELPPLLLLNSEAEYREHYVRTLVNGPPVITPDGVLVVFYEDKFEHAFFERPDTKPKTQWLQEKISFSENRAQRMNRIRFFLMLSQAETYREPAGQGRFNRIVVHGLDRYLIITLTVHPGKERFVTAYQCSEEKLINIRKLPRWK